MKWIGIALLVVVILVIIRNETTPANIGVKEGGLRPCPTTPNCVLSGAVDPVHAIDPLPVATKNPLTLIEDFFTSHYIAKVVKKTDNYLHIVISTPFFHFKDDLEFLVNKGDQNISVRSASRIGYSDRGVNRRRIEKLRAFLNMKEKEGENL